MMSNVLTLIRKKENNCALSGVVTSLDAECRNCAPISPLQCINRCQVYKLKNELRCLGQAMDNPHYMRDLFNALKNVRRLQVLRVIENNRYSVKQLKQELKRTAQKQGQATFNEEYVRPLIAVGLASEAREEYCASSFGIRLTERLGCFADFVEKLPTHSEGHEEMLLQFLISGPKTFEEIEGAIEPSVVSRTLKRLRSAGLVKSSKEKDYVFFFKTIRDPNKETLSANERKVYSAVFCEGISAGELSKRIRISKRLTYRYLKRLRGKKLVFTRRTPKTYRLTCKGKSIAAVIENIQQLVDDAWASSQQIIQGSAGISAKMRGLSRNANLR
jgi:DNA-binding transcriptional ArsR family regulator